MNTLDTLQRYANEHWSVDKTRKTSCSFKRGAIMITEKRLWVWFAGSNSPVLVKEEWLTGSDKSDFADMFKSHMTVGYVSTKLYG